ncbi:MBL fold metallo-hydrolase [Luteococcus japonicus]|uniref:Putative metallo-beta-lactamase n=1 Tax=Luteococcus japonicus LSP_Lj1 TaxID=1255658 RepID=A0A1R4JI67_9ACTN|nr:MBL fold metallo-hydrolase [Luteococcus japonicus]SJN31709.1 putative metallo-beta-lactamase [Luteococcus japonicus LSP_Lj1]
MREFSIGGWQLVRDGIHVVQLQPASVNAGLIIGETGVMLVDTGSSPSQGRELAASAAELAGRPVTHVVVTHAHFDHFYGLAGVMEAAPSAVSIGHENLAAHLDGTNDPDVDPEVIRTDLGFDPSELVAPNDPMAFIRAVDLGGRVVELVHLGHGHSDSDIFVQVPDARVTFVGDMVETASDPMVGPDSHVDTWPKAIDGVMSNAKSDTLFVPGHGPVADLEQVNNQRAAISMLWSTAEDCIKKGMSIDDVVTDLNGPREVEWPFAPQAVANALPWLYKALEAQGVTKSRLLPLLGN